MADFNFVSIRLTPAADRACLAAAMLISQLFSGGFFSQDSHFIFTGRMFVKNENQSQLTSTGGIEINTSPNFNTNKS